MVSHQNRLCLLSTKARVKLGMVNVQSISNKVDDFVHHVTAHDYDICAISKTWLCADDKVDALIVGQLKANEYSSIHSPKNDTHREPPYSEKRRKAVEMFISKFSDVLSETLTLYDSSRLIILGDFNFHVDNPQTSDAVNFTDMLESFDWIQYVGVTHESKHILDLCIAPGILNLCILAILADYFISDHTFVSSKVSLRKPPSHKKQVNTRHIASMEKQKFREDLNAVCGDLIRLSGDELVFEYESKLRELLEVHARLKTKSVLVRKKNVAWFDNRAKLLQAETRKLAKAWKQTLNWPFTLICIILNH